MEERRIEKEFGIPEIGKQREKGDKA